jgi:uncharacterized membrane protein
MLAQTHVDLNFSPILIKIRMSQHSLLKLSNNKCNWSPSSGSRGYTRTHRQRNVCDECNSRFKKKNFSLRKRKMDLARETYYAIYGQLVSQKLMRLCSLRCYCEVHTLSSLSFLLYIFISSFLSFFVVPSVLFCFFSFAVCNIYMKRFSAHSNRLTATNKHSIFSAFQYL